MSWSFLPKNPHFFTFFSQMADHINTSTSLLPKLLHKKKVTKLVLNIRSHEEKTNKLRHILIEQADNTFITPIDREDIHALARNLDTLIDDIEDIASRIHVYNTSRPPKYLAEFFLLITKTGTTIEHLINTLPDKEQGIASLKKDIQKLHDLETQGDILIRNAMKELFAKKSVLVILKWKDIFEQCENFLDHAEQTGDIVNEIIIKNF